MRRSLLARLFGVLLWLTVLGPVEAAPAGGVVGNGTPDSCNAATLAAALSGGGSVTFNCGGPKTILLTAVNTINHNTVLDGSGVITLTGSFTSTTRLFSISAGLAVTLKNIVLANGQSGANDGGILLNHGTLTLQNVRLQGGRADASNRGGAIATDGPLFISGSTFFDNIAGSGGALYATGPGALVQVTGSDFSNGQAFSTLDGYGGAIWVDAQAQLWLDHSPVAFNQAYRGGGLYISSGGLVTVTSATTEFAFQYNLAHIQGGAVSNEPGGLLTTVGAVFDHNRVPTNTADSDVGGAIFSAGPLALHNTYLRNNQAKYGGAIGLDVAGSPKSILLDHVAVGLNNAAILGGGMYASFASAHITITASLFTENSAGVAGGGIARHNAHLYIQDSSFEGNFTGTGGGGALWMDASPSTAGGAVQILDSTISGNHAPSANKGGGIYNTGALANLRNVTLAENDEGIFLTGPFVTLSTTNSVYWNDGFINCSGSGAHPLSLGGNYSSDNSCNFSQPSDETNVNHNPLFLPPYIDTSDFQYAVIYYLPLPADSLINSALPVCSARDQRGAFRPNACDKGAVELGGLLPRIFAPFLRK